LEPKDHPRGLAVGSHPTVALARMVVGLAGDREFATDHIQGLPLAQENLGLPEQVDDLLGIESASAVCPSLREPVASVTHNLAQVLAGGSPAVAVRLAVMDIRTK